jgi:pantothenate synthetase (EC 6.3.2.1)
MQITKSIKEIRRLIVLAKKQGKTIGFVPTMGYLHEGHLSLLRQAKKDCDICVVSIFVNPIQFGPREDFKKYPRNIKRDECLSKRAGVDIIFYPSADQMYPSGYSTYVNVEKLSNVLCAKSRTGHFKGVATVVAKLFNIVQPDIAYFGQKDAQQAIIIHKMAQDLNMPLTIKVMPTVREKDGLAMSSRNVYLNHQGRRDATILNMSLKDARQMIKQGERSSQRIISHINKIIKGKANIKIDYIECVDAQDLLPLKKL